MIFTDPTDITAVTRDLLAEKRDKDLIVSVLQKRGMDEEAARELVKRVYRENLWTNRRSSLLFLFGGGLVTLILVGIYITSGVLYYVLLPFSGIAFVWGIIRFVTASGYEVESKGDVDLEGL